LPPRPLLQIAPSFEPEPPDLAAHAQPAAQPADKLLVLPRLFAQAVVHVQRRRFTVKIEDHP
jgi:hypothetical protein